MGFACPQVFLIWTDELFHEERGVVRFVSGEGRRRVSRAKRESKMARLFLEERSTGAA
jgi:hypothetical protein